MVTSSSWRVLNSAASVCVLLLNIRALIALIDGFILVDDDDDELIVIFLKVNSTLLLMMKIDEKCSADNKLKRKIKIKIKRNDDDFLLLK